MKVLAPVDGSISGAAIPANAKPAQPAIIRLNAKILFKVPPP
jgi:hypothetical protein